ncbi:glycosyltransferase [candidate division KSB1 bacterium]|nr:glycosyltransferase [candidate division KSB1 bacterium]
MPRVSIIIPTYNRASFLPQAIQSVLKQTFKDFELIVIDDASDDSTPQVLAQFSKKLTAYRLPENRGVSAARNLGIERAQGEYIAFLDSDDQWKPEKLQTQMLWIQRNPEINACYTDEIWIRNGVRINPGKRYTKYDGWFLEKMLPLCFINPSSVLINREVFDEVGVFDESLPACEDYDLWLRINVRYPITLIPQKLIIKFGDHPDQLSHQFWGIDRFRVQALEKLLQNPWLKNEQRDLVIQTIQEKCKILAEGCYKRGKIMQGKSFEAISNRYA